MCSSVQRCVTLAFALSISIMTHRNCAAAIIIDDFADDLRIDVPDQKSEWFLTAGVGDLQASRSARIIGLQTDPSGFLDVDQIEPSTLTAVISETAHTNIRPSLGINLGYTFVYVPFTGVDLTQGGENNAVILTFDRLTAAVPLRGLQVSVTYGPTSAHYSSPLTAMPYRNDPFSMVFPFADFRLDRGSPASEFVFSNARELAILVNLALINPNLPEELDFHMVLTDIRIARIPEPPASYLLILMSLLLGFACLRARRPHLGVTADTPTAWNQARSILRLSSG